MIEGSGFRAHGVLVEILLNRDEGLGALFIAKVWGQRPGSRAESIVPD